MPTTDRGSLPRPGRRHPTEIIVGAAALIAAILATPAGAHARDEGDGARATTTGTTTTTTETVAPRATVPVFLFPLDRVDIDEARARLVEDLVLTELANVPGVAVSSWEGVKDDLARAATAMERGCAEGEAACFVDVAASLGARFVVTGSVTLQEGVVHVELVLVDSHAGTPLAREHVSARAATTLHERLGQAITNLFASFTGQPRVAVLDERAPRRFDDGTELLAAAAGGGALGVTLAVALAAPAVVVGLTIADPTRAVVGGVWLPSILLYLALGGVPIVGALSGATAMLVGDVLADADDLALLRAALTGAVDGVVALAGVLVGGATVLVTLISVWPAIVLNTGRTLESPMTPSDQVLVVGAGLVASAVAGAVAVLAVGTTHLALFALTESPPVFGEE